MERVRLNKYLAQCGICSRRDADRLIGDGRVTVDGQTAQAGQQVDDGMEILVDGKPVRAAQKKVVLLYHKPFGVICTEKDPHAKRILADEVQYPVRVTYAGRLDKDSQGLLILTNDGDLIEEMMRGANGHEKEYLVRVREKLTQETLDRLAAGIYLKELDVKTRPCRVEQTGESTFRIVLTQGLNRQIRRMCDAVNYHVIRLKRVRVVNLKLGSLKPGEYREATDGEVRELWESLRGR